MNQYPTWRYHQTAPAKIIQSAAEEAEGWFDSPAKVPQLAPGEAVAPVAGSSPAEAVLPVSPAPFDEHIAADVFTDRNESQSTLNDPPKRRGRPRKARS